MVNARHILEEISPDIIFYPDIGMKLKTYLLAYSRISKVQITTWGHSETSGLNTIDYYISSKYFHNNTNTNTNKKININPDDYFIEKLVQMPSLSTYYISPIIMLLQGNIKNFKNKIELGFEESDNIYGCLQTFYKLNCEFEEILNQILLRDPNAIILMSNAGSILQEPFIKNKKYSKSQY